MSREEKQQSQQAELQKQLWSIANSLRGNMDANDFKNYILGLIFYRYLSENLVNYVENVMLRNKMKYADMFKDKEQAQEFKSDLIEEENTIHKIITSKHFSHLTHCCLYLAICTVKISSLFQNELIL